MSSEEHEPHADVDHDDHDEFDPSPIQTLAEDEPLTPLWLPAVGVALLGLGGLYVAFGGEEEAPPAPTPAVTAAEPRAAAAPAGAPVPSAMKREDLAERLRAIRDRRQGTPPAPARRPGAAR